MSTNPTVLVNQPIGIFDSGLGGLSVAKDIKAILPNENLVVIADSGFAPYGDKPQEYIEARAFALTEQLINQNAKAVVVACNTATVTTINKLRNHFSLPIIGIEPGIKPAALNSKAGIVGILSTASTSKSEQLTRLIDRFHNNSKVIIQPCPGLVEQVEKLELNSEKTTRLLQSYINPLVKQGIDTLVLGCTHYPLLSTQIQALVGDSVQIIDTGIAVAKEVKRRLEAVNGLNTNSIKPTDIFTSTGQHQQLEQALKLIWKDPAVVKEFSHLEQQIEQSIQ